MRYLCLDVGNVLVHVDFSPFLRAVSSRLNITLEDAQYFMTRTCKLHDLGLTCMEDELKNHFQIKSQVILQELLGTWNTTISRNEHMFDKVVEWSTEKQVKIALLSNVGLEHVKVMEQLLSLDKHPEIVKYFSCRVGARKPSSLYYQSFLQLYPEWTGAVYVDDLQENLDASMQFGFRPYHFSLEDSTYSYSSGPPVLHRIQPKKLQQMEALIFGDQP